MLRMDYEQFNPYMDHSEIFLIALADGYTPAAADAFATELVAAYDEDMRIQCEGEMAAENAWLIHAENAGFDEAMIEAEHERAMGVIPFSEAYHS